MPIPLIVGGGIALAKGLSGRKKSPSAQGPQLTPQEQQLLGTQNDIASFNLDTMKRLLPQAEKLLGQTEGVYQKLLTGSPDVMREFFSPEINSIHSGADQAIKQLLSGSQRGGGMAQAISGVQSDAARDLTDLITGGRKAGLAGLDDLSRVLLSGAQGSGQLSSSSASSGLQTLLGMRDLQERRNAQKSQNWLGLGQMAGMLLGPLLAGRK